MPSKPPPISEYHLNRNDPSKPQFALHDLNGYLKTNRPLAAKPHIHSFYQVIWFKKGVGKHSVDFRDYEVSDASVFLISQNQVHYFDENTDYEGVLIHFNALFLTKNDSETELFLKQNLFNNPYRPPFCRPDAEMRAVLDVYVAQMQQELQNGETFGKELLLINALKSLLVQIQRQKNALESSADPSFPAIADEKRLQLAKFINLIDENYPKGLRVAEYADRLHVSSRTLLAITQQQLGKTPSQMIQERTILEAKRLLLYSELNGNQIGYRLGFEDPSYFVKYFKKHTGLSPSAFKKSVS